MSRYLRTFKLTKEYRDIKPFTIQFREGLNVLVGENGSGKSTILQMLAQQIGEGCYEIDALRGTDTRFLDTEKMNPRIKSTCFDSKNLGYEIGSRFTSHGEAMLPLLIASRDFKKLVLIIDEPEAGISLKNQMKILEAFDVALENDCQVIVTTHSYVLIHEVDEVFDLDTRKWTTSRDYLEKTLQTIL